MPPLLEARHARKVFESAGMFREAARTVAVDDFSLTVQDDIPSFTTIAGESGSGKTTIARLLLGLASTSSGEILYRGRSIDSLSRTERARFRLEVQAIFQDPFEVYNPFYKVDHILTVPMRKFGLAQSRRDERKMIERALETVGLRPDETLGRYPHQLSGGQRQRMTIARALLIRPRLIIADEPVSMVDASLRATILEGLHTLYRDFGISFLYITHDLTTAYQVSENLVILYHGRVAEAGKAETVIDHPEHPYTQELIRSIPSPEPDGQWLAEPVKEKSEEEEAAAPSASTEASCLYAPRCPHAMDRCWREVPPLYRTSEVRASACFLYEKAPPLGDVSLSAVFSDGAHGNAASQPLM